MMTTTTISHHRKHRDWSS